MIIITITITMIIIIMTHGHTAPSQSLLNQYQPFAYKNAHALNFLLFIALHCIDISLNL